MFLDNGLSWRPSDYQLLDWQQISLHHHVNCQYNILSSWSYAPKVPSFWSSKTTLQHNAASTMVNPLQGIEHLNSTPLLDIPRFFFFTFVTLIKMCKKYLFSTNVIFLEVPILVLATISHISKCFPSVNYEKELKASFLSPGKQKLHLCAKKAQVWSNQTKWQTKLIPMF